MSEAEELISLLLVEDSPGDAFLLRSMLEDHGPYNVTEAASLGEAKTVLAEQPCDVVMLDLTLPDSHGLNTVRELSAAAPEIPIVVLTGLTDETVALEAVRQGAQDYLVKGRTEVGVLARAIRYAIDRKEAEVALRKAHDELEQRVQERTEDLRRLNQILRMTSSCSQALVHIHEEPQLVKEICRIIHDVGNFQMVSVDYVGQDRARIVRTVGSAGVEQRYSQSAELACGDGAASQAGKAKLDEDVERAAPPLSRSGARFSIALPLRTSGQIFGTLSIHSSEHGTFDEERAAMLQELADDLAFGISTLWTRAERDRAQEALKRRALQLQALASELSQVEQRERRRLAQVLHDHIQQLLVGAKLSAEMLKRKGNADGSLDQLIAILKEAIQASRSLAVELSPPVLHEKGLGAGLEWLGRQMRKKYDLDVQVESDEASIELSEYLRNFLFEATRELLFNIVKHAGVKSACVELACLEGQVTVAVTDEGVGFDPALLKTGDVSMGGFGLFSIRERLGYVGGHLEIESAPGSGSRVVLVAPAQI